MIPPKSPLKVVWICHFTNDEIQRFVKPRKRINQYAPWIYNTICSLEGLGEIELHIISPHEYISGPRLFVRNGVHYYFFNPYIPIFGRHWPGILRWDYISDFFYSKYFVGKLVERINPDIIHLQGAENPHYSSAVIQFKEKHPVVVNLQRMTLENKELDSRWGNRRIAVETRILREFKHYSVRTKQMKTDLLTINPNAITHFVEYKIPELKPIDIPKEYDLVYFARISKNKGIEDLISALYHVKSVIPNVMLCVIGSVSESYLNTLKTKALVLGLEKNIAWEGHLPTLEEVHYEVSKARVSVLPTHYDIIPGTIVESMQLGLPVVSYRVGSIPELNDERENLLLVDVGDIKGLSNSIIRLLTDSTFYHTMSSRGIECMKIRYGNTNILEQHLRCYQEVITDYKRNQGLCMTYDGNLT